MNAKKRLLVLLVAVMVLSLATISTFADVWDTFPQQKKGDQNDYVRALQTVAKYYNPSSITVDANFGSGTKSAIKKFQENYGFSSSEQDGIVGTKTWKAMRETLGSPARITGSGTGNGSVSSSGGYVGYKLYQQESGTYTNLYYFRYDRTETDWFDVYVAAPGSTPGTWYWINPRS